MARTEREVRCRRHPKHKESKGVCPYCLRERLSTLSASSSSSTANSSSDSSAGSSPAKASEGGRDAPVITKSRSLVFVLGGQREVEKDVMDMKKTKKKGMLFWSRLMVAGSGRRERDGGELLHSKTIKEKASTKWVLFS